MTRVVNIRTTPTYDVYIGRAGRGQSGYFGNPFSKADVGSREEAIRLYREWFYERLETDSVFKEGVLALKNKTLACHCHPLSCHGDVIVEYLEGPVVKKVQLKLL